MLFRHSFMRSSVVALIDYCNGLFVGISEGLLDRLQRIQNAAARLVTGTRKYEHITPVLRSLHWLPVRQRIVFKVATFVFKCLHSLAPSYLAGDCVLKSTMPNRQRLRSASSQELDVPRTTNKMLGPTCVWRLNCGPTIWNKLPVDL